MLLYCVFIFIIISIPPPSAGGTNSNERFSKPLLCEKLAEQNARGQVDRIKESILSLDTFPQSHQERTVEMYVNKGYRQLLIDNYITIFRIDEEKKDVYVITVQYQGRNI